MTKQAKQITISDWLQLGVLRISRVHFFVVAALIAQVILYDAWKVLTPDAVMWRWISALLLLAVTTIVWHLAHNLDKSPAFYKSLVFALIGADIAIATFGIYTQRGMASRTVFLYAIPIIVSAILLSRVALFTTATLCIAAYVATAIIYFTNYFNEGYKAELYAEVGFYSVGFLLLAGLLSTVIHFKNQ